LPSHLPSITQYNPPSSLHLPPFRAPSPTSSSSPFFVPHPYFSFIVILISAFSEFDISLRYTQSNSQQHPFHSKRSIDSVTLFLFPAPIPSNYSTTILTFETPLFNFSTLFSSLGGAVPFTEFDSFRIISIVTALLSTKAGSIPSSARRRSLGSQLQIIAIARSIITATTRILDTPSFVASLLSSHSNLDH